MNGEVKMTAECLECFHGDTVAVVAIHYGLGWFKLKLACGHERRVCY